MKHRELGNLLRISRCFDSYRRAQLKDADIYPALHLFVSHICRHPGCAQETLVDALCVDKTTVAHHLARLEEKGYIERRISEEDARCRLVFPTQKALDLFPQLRASYEAFYDALFENISPEDRETFARLGETLCQNARALLNR